MSCSELGTEEDVSRQQDPLSSSCIFSLRGIRPMKMRLYIKLLLLILYAFCKQNRIPSLHAQM